MQTIYLSARIPRPRPQPHTQPRILSDIRLDCFRPDIDVSRSGVTATYVRYSDGVAGEDDSVQVVMGHAPIAYGHVATVDANGSDIPGVPRQFVTYLDVSLLYTRASPGLDSVMRGVEALDVWTGTRLVQIGDGYLRSARTGKIRFQLLDYDEA